MKRYRIVVVDDHALVRCGIVQTLADVQDFDVVGEGGSAADAIQLVAATRPDLVTLDVTMPGGGVQAAAAIRSAHPDVRIIMLSVRESPSTARAALAAGADGYVVKGVDGAVLVGVVRKVLAGQLHIDTAIAAALDGSDGAVSPRSDPSG